MGHSGGPSYPFSLYVIGFPPQNLGPNSYLYTCDIWIKIIYFQWMFLGIAHEILTFSWKDLRPAFDFISVKFSSLAVNNNVICF